MASPLPRESRDRKPHARGLGLAALLVLSAIGAGPAGPEAGRRPLTVDDGLNLAGFPEACVSPDGGRILYGRSDLDWNGNGRRFGYFMVSAAGGPATRFIGEAGGASFAFSPDGRAVSFLRNQQVHLIPVSGGEPARLTRHDGGARSPRWSADSTWIYFLAQDLKRRPEDLAPDRSGSDAVFVDEGPNGRDEGRWTNVWSVDARTGSEARVTDEAWIVGDYDVSADGRVVLTARRENRRNRRDLSEIYLVPPGGRPVRLTDNAVPETSVAWSPDGRLVAFLAPDDRAWELRQARIWVLDAATREIRPVSSAFDGEITGYVWDADSRSILFTGQRRTDVNVFRLDTATGAVVPVTAGAGTVVPLGYSADRGRLVYAWSDAETPPELFVTSTRAFDPIPLTSANASVPRDRLLGRARVVRWKSRDGLEIEGLLYLPPEAVAGGRVPLIVHLHGGPAGGFTNRFNYVYQTYAGLGWASLCPNVRGSAGYGDAFLRANMGDICGRDADDVLAGVDEVVRQGVADPGRLAVRGWSYGGILAAWTLTRTDRFKAASVGGMVSDWSAEYGVGFNYDVRLWYIGGTPWDNPDAYRDRSVLTHAAKITAPVIIFHGGQDTTDTEAQSMNFFSYLRDMGKVARYIRFPREPHGFNAPRSQRLRDVEEIRWMEKHVLGRDWTPWARGLR